MIPYDQDEESPPAPVTDCTVLNPYSNAAKVDRAKLDTGASCTAIPQDLVNELGLVRLRERELFDFRGRMQKHWSYYITFQMDGNNFPWIEVIATSRSNVLVGRDILNQLKIILDGKHQCFDLNDP